MSERVSESTNSFTPCRHPRPFQGENIVGGLDFIYLFSSVIMMKNRKKQKIIIKNRHLLVALHNMSYSGPLLSPVQHRGHTELVTVLILDVCKIFNYREVQTAYSDYKNRCVGL